MQPPRFAGVRGLFQFSGLDDGEKGRNGQEDAGGRCRYSVGAVGSVRPFHGNINGDNAPGGDVDGHRRTWRTDGTTEPVVEDLTIGLRGSIWTISRGAGYEFAWRNLAARFVGQQRGLGTAMLDKPTRNRVAARGRQGCMQTVPTDLHPCVELRVGKLELLGWPSREHFDDDWLDGGAATRSSPGCGPLSIGATELATPSPKKRRRSRYTLVQCKPSSLSSISA